MKKFLSIFVAVAMVFSLFAGSFAPRASAAPGLTIDDTAKHVPWTWWNWTGSSDNLPDATTVGVLANDTATPTHYYMYTMGDIIHGTIHFADVAANAPISVRLYAWNMSAYDVLIETNTMYQVAGLLEYPFQISTGNVQFDGPYMVMVSDGNESRSELVLVKYNLTWKSKALPVCTDFAAIDGWILRGNYMAPARPVVVGITYPGNKLAQSYFVQNTGSGQFSMTFPVTIPGDIGDFRLYVRDQYPSAAITYANLLTGTGTWTALNYADDPSGFTDLESAAAWTGPTGNPDNDALIYDTLTNVPTNVAITASTYYSPVLLYKGLNAQTLVLQLVDQDGAYLSNANWSIAFGSGAFAAATETEISPGFYRLTFDVPLTAVDVRFKATSTSGITSGESSNTVIINTRDLGAFNPYVDVNASWVRQSADSQLDCLTGRYVYDKLPCTIGNTLDIKVGSWQPVDPDNWYVAKASYTITGPVRQLLPKTFGTTGAGTFIIEEAGKIAVSIKLTMWERIKQVITHTDVSTTEVPLCIDWFSKASTGEYTDHYGYWDHEAGDWFGTFAGTWSTANKAMMAENACCRIFEKTFDICEVKSCVLTSVTLEGAGRTDATTIEVGKKADLVVNISGANAPAGLSCGCNTKIVKIYMVDANCAIVPGAFSVDPWSGGEAEDVTELWYNGIPDSLLLNDHTNTATRSSSDMPDGRYYIGTTGYGTEGSVHFAATTGNAVIIDNCEKLTFKGVTFNYINDTGAPCTYNLVVEVFGLQRSFDSCGNMKISYPFISETVNDIKITPAVKTLSTTPTVYELGIDPIDILAGVPVTIEITDPLFTVDAPSSRWSSVAWTYSFNGVASSLLSGFPVMTPSTIDSGYKFSFSCAFPEAGTLVITGTSWNTYLDCSAKEVVAFTLKVVLPAFDVQIELLDGTKIANDHIITEGLVELIHVVPTDPRADGHHDFTTDTTWDLTVAGLSNDCGLPTSKVCGTTPVGCTTPSPIAVYGLDNPNIEDTPQFELYFSLDCGTDVLIDTFSLVKPTVTLTPAEVPFTIPASATHVVFTVKDAHGHGAPGVHVGITGVYLSNAGASGYSFEAGAATTDKTGEADWAFVPPYSGEYSVGIGVDAYPACFVLPCGWSTFSATKTLTAKYQAPVVDTTAPVVSITTGIDGSKVTSSTLNLTGKVTDNVGVTQLFVGFNKVDVLPDGSFMTALKLVEGENTIAVVAYDAAGNKGTATAKVTYTAPVDTSTVLVLTIGADIVSVNGKATSIDAAPEIVASRTFVPIRFIAESFGATVEWLPETQGITITLGEHTVGLQIGNATAVVDGTIISLPAAPYIKSGRTMVPLRLISEAFGGDVVWDAATRTITITYQP